MELADVAINDEPLVVEIDRVKPKLDKEKLPSPPRRNITFGYENTRLDKEIEERLKKIANKKSLWVTPADKATWQAHQQHTQQHIAKLNRLHKEQQTDPVGFKGNYGQAKLNADGSIKYTAEQRLASYQRRAKLYKEWQYKPGIADEYFELARTDPVTGKETQKVVTHYDQTEQRALITAENSGTDDQYILMMVEQARDLAKQIATRGETAADFEIEIKNCENMPATAVKLKHAIEILGFAAVMNAETNQAVQNYLSQQKPIPPVV